MNRIVVSVPRVLDSALNIIHDDQLVVPTGNLPSTAVAPFTVNKVRAVTTETVMTNTTVTPLNNKTRCSRVTATATIPLTLTITDANNLQYETHTSMDKELDIVLYVPDENIFNVTITSEGSVGCACAKADSDNTTLQNLTTKILTRVMAVTDLLIPVYGYAPTNFAENFQPNNNQNFINQPLFPAGKIY